VPLDEDADVPAEYREAFDRAREAALADRSKSRTKDPVSERAWGMEPRHRGWGGVLSVESRFERPLEPANRLLRQWKFAGIGAVIVGSGLLLYSGWRLAAVPGPATLAGAIGSAALLTVGAGVWWWTTHRGRSWADQGLLSELQ
jgi:hypothetical protein